MTDERRVETDGGPSYCSSCGSELDPGDSYCSDCGSVVDDSATDSGDTTTGQSSSSGRDADSADERQQRRRAFRTRVNQYLSDGWEVQYDAGDEVALVDRDFGSGWVHLLLFLFTGGIGNCIYGWYNYERQAEQIVLRAEDVSPDAVRQTTGMQSPEYAAGTAQPNTATQTHAEFSNNPAQTEYAVGNAASDDKPLSHYIGGIFLFLLGVYIMGTSLTEVSSFLFGIGVTLAALLVFPPVRERLRNRHPPTTFGPTKTTEERVVSGTDQLCSVCQEPVNDGVVREYEEEYVLAGIPLYTMEAGENWYCKSCHRDRHQFTSDIDTDPEMELETELN